MILINGTSAADYGVTFEAGTLEELYKMPPMKGYASYGSRHIDGMKVSAAGRKVGTQEVQLPFIIRGSTRADYLTKLAALTELLRVGKRHHRANLRWQNMEAHLYRLGTRPIYKRYNF